MPRFDSREAAECADRFPEVALESADRFCRQISALGPSRRCRPERIDFRHVGRHFECSRKQLERKSLVDEASTEAAAGAISGDDLETEAVRALRFEKLCI